MTNLDTEARIRLPAGRQGKSAEDKKNAEKSKSKKERCIHWQGCEESR